MDPKHKTLKQHTSKENDITTAVTGDIEGSNSIVGMHNGISNNEGKIANTVNAPNAPVSTQVDRFKNLLDESAKQAFARPWHRLERGLRLNRLRLYVEEMSPRCSFNEDEKNRFFNFLQNALDRKLLNTNKIVNYIPEEQKIISIRSLEVKRNGDGTARWGFVIKKSDSNQTRKKK